MVLTKNFLYTFKDQKVYRNPTETIRLKSIMSIKSSEEELGQKNTFVICQLSREFRPTKPYFTLRVTLQATKRAGLAQLVLLEGCRESDGAQQQYGDRRRLMICLAYSLVLVLISILTGEWQRLSSLSGSVILENLLYLHIKVMLKKFR